MRGPEKGSTWASERCTGSCLGERPYRVRWNVAVPSWEHPFRSVGSQTGGHPGSASYDWAGLRHYRTGAQVVRMIAGRGGPLEMDIHAASVEKGRPGSLTQIAAYDGDHQRGRVREGPEGEGCGGALFGPETGGKFGWKWKGMLPWCVALLLFDVERAWGDTDCAPTGCLNIWP